MPSESVTSLTGKLVEMLPGQSPTGRWRFLWRGRKRELHPNVRIALVACLARLRALDACEGAVGLEDELAGLRKEHRWLESGGDLSEEQAWALADSLQWMWVRFADKAALSEAVPKQDQYGLEQRSDDFLRALVSRRLEAQQVEQAQDRLRRALRSKYLRGGGISLAGAVLTLWVIALVIVNDRVTLTLCALAGIVGGLIASALRLRDSQTIVNIQIFHTWWWVQPAVGAAVGMFIYALLRTQILVLPGTAATDDAVSRAAASVVYAFLAGFSEPWLLRVLEGLGGGTDAANSRSIRS